MIRVEEWRGVVDHESRYEVSSRGRVRSVRAHLILKPQVRKGGYLAVSIHGNKRLIHQLVAEAFHGPKPRPELVVRHLDGDPTNNTPGNVIWGTRSENELDKVRHGRHHAARRTHCPQGHAYTPENTYTSPSRYERRCRACLQTRNDARPRKRVSA